MTQLRDLVNIARRLRFGSAQLRSAWPGVERSVRSVVTETLDPDMLDEEPAIPENAYIPYDVKTIEATVREASGRLPSNKLRQAGRTPAMLVALNRNKSLMLTVDSKQISSEVRTYGRTGIVSRIYTLRVLGDDPKAGDYRVLPRQVHMCSVDGTIENVNFIWCPPEKRLSVQIPVKVLGEESCPGVKQGGFLNLIRRSVSCSCPGWAIPPYLEVDASVLDIGQRVMLEDLPLSQGVYIVEKHMDYPVLKVAGKASRD